MQTALDNTQVCVLADGDEDPVYHCIATTRSACAILRRVFSQGESIISAFCSHYSFLTVCDSTEDETLICQRRLASLFITTSILGSYVALSARPKSHLLWNYSTASEKNYAWQMGHFGLSLAICQTLFFSDADLWFHNRCDLGLTLTVTYDAKIDAIINKGVNLLWNDYINQYLGFNYYVYSISYDSWKLNI